MENRRERFWEIDFLRGLAIVLMIALHVVDDLYFVAGYRIKLNLGIWQAWQQVTATLFLLLVGVSLTLSHSKTTQSGSGTIGLFKRHLYKGGVIFGWGLLVTVVTRLLLKEGFIAFGILHLIGVVVILSFPFLTWRFGNVFLGLVLIGLGSYLSQFRFSFPWLLWAGFVPEGYFSVDYFPLLPWFGVVLLGLCLGNILYPGHQRQFPLKDGSNSPFLRFFCFLGRNSLVIYLAHQPILLALLTLAGVILLK